MSLKMVIVGAGGHARVVIDAIHQLNAQEPKYQILGLVDDVTGITEFCSYPVETHLSKFDTNNFVVAIGDNRVRSRVFLEALALNYQAISIVHPSAILAPDVKVGAGSMILAGTVINAAASIGANCIVNTATSIDHECIIADHCHVAPGCTLAGNVVVGAGVFLGIGTKVIPRIRIGAWAMSGAGAVIVKDVDESSKMLGVPARAVVGLER